MVVKATKRTTIPTIYKSRLDPNSNAQSREQEMLFVVDGVKYKAIVHHDRSYRHQAYAKLQRFSKIDTWETLVILNTHDFLIGSVGVIDPFSAVYDEMYKIACKFEDS